MDIFQLKMAFFYSPLIIIVGLIINCIHKDLFKFFFFIKWEFRILYEIFIRCWIINIVHIMKVRKYNILSQLSVVYDTVFGSACTHPRVRLLELVHIILHCYPNKDRSRYSSWDWGLVSKHILNGKDRVSIARVSFRVFRIMYTI